MPRTLAKDQGQYKYTLGICCHPLQHVNETGRKSGTELSPRTEFSALQWLPSPNQEDSLMTGRILSLDPSWGVDVLKRENISLGRHVCWSGP